MTEVQSHEQSRAVRTVLLAGVLPWLIALAARIVFGNTEHISQPLHEAMELVGSCIALGVALLLSLRSAHEGVEARTLWVISALVAMGLVDGAHGLTPYGVPWSWLRHGATLVGGLLFGLVWLALPPAVVRRGHLFILAVAVFAVAGAGALSWNPTLLPAPWDQLGYTLPVKVVNAIGGLGFVAASVFFLRRDRRQRQGEDLLFASQTMLFGAASLLFGFSARWSADWWAWHVFRLGAYTIVLVAARRVVVTLYRQVERDARQAKETSLALQTENAERRRAEAELQAHRLQLEQLVAQRTEALSRTEDLLRAVSDTTEDAIYVKDVHSRLLMINPACVRIVGKPVDEIVGRTDEEFYDDPSIGAAIMEHDRLLVRSGKAQVFEEIVDTPAGRRTMLSSKVPWRNAEGEIVGIIGISRDITERKSAEAELGESRRKYQALIETTSDFIWETDSRGRYTYCSPQMEGLWGIRPQDMIGRTPFDVMPAEDRDAAAASFMELAKSPRPFRGLESAAYDGHGRLIRVEASGVPFFDEKGSLLGFRGISRDVTARTEAEQALRDSEERLRRQATDLAEANRLKDEFLSTLSHELRTPLNAILGWAVMLQSGRLDPATARSAYDVIVRNANAQRQLIDDTLDVARIVTGRLKVDLQDTDLAVPLAATIDTIRPMAEAKGIEVVCHFEPALPTVLADATRVRQMFWNLLSNAVKFTPRGGRVTVCGRRVDSEVEVSVGDTGIGISGAFLPHVFERFTQADGSTTRAHGGLGLGLAIVRHLAELHGGIVQAESAGEGQGATFTIRLPIRAVVDLPHCPPERGADPSKTPDGRIEGTPLKGIDVLVVDDMQDARDLMAMCLEQAGAAVKAAASASEALEALRQDRFDIVVADIGMPGEDGYSLIRRVRALPLESGGATPAMALTAYAKAEDRSQALAAGYQEHLAKPVTPDALVRAVAALARRFVASRP